MDTTDFKEVYDNEHVKDFLHRSAWRRSRKDRAFWNDLMSEAWIRISESEPGKTSRYYCMCGARAIEACYRRDLRAEKKQEAILRRLLDKIEEERAVE